MFEQDRTLMRLQQRVQSEGDIRVCFLSGSYGRRSQDPFSDLDVALVFADETRRGQAWGDRRAFVQSVLPYVPARSFDAEHIRPYFHIVLYGNGCKVDFRYETKELLQPNPWDRDIRILKDDHGWAEQYQADSARAALVQPHLTTEALAALDNRFWVMFMDVYRLLRRGDHDKPFAVYLELLHFTLPSLLHVLPPGEPARQGLLQAHFSADTEATIRHLVQLLDAYLAARTAVIRRFNLAFTPDAAFENGIKRLLR